MGKALYLRAFCKKRRSGLFWANNNYDRWTNDNYDNIQVEDDVSQAVNPGTQYVEPDFNYTNSSGQRAISCPRDLEDFARLWVSGISSNVLANLPTGSTVTLSWQNGNGVTIDLFQAADADGGIGYLTNLATASNQLAPSLYVGRLGPGQSIQLNASTFSNSWAGNHYIWCGVFPGSDQLNLTITDSSGNTLAQSVQYIQIQDIKQMYERWTVGDISGNPNGTFPAVAPMSNAVPAEDNFSPGYPNQYFTYSYDQATDTNDNYILFVHGYNLESWQKDRFAETAFKRLYWQGYQGRFGSFRWPTYPAGELFDDSERQAWLSGAGLLNLLGTLNSNYPGKVYLLAHSLGNVVAGEALRLAGAKQVVNTYVASQAALSARAYDNTIPSDATNYYTPISPDSIGHYYTNTSPPYFNGIAAAGTFVNFINTNDWALMGDNLFTGHPGWLEIQQGKLLLTTQPMSPSNPQEYWYTTPSSNHPSGYYFQNGPITPYRNLLFPNDTFEIFSEAAQSYSLALGAESTIPVGFARSVNLFGAPYNFGPTHYGHSLEFRSDNMTTAVYWHELLFFGFNIQP